MDSTRLPCSAQATSKQQLQWYGDGVSSPKTARFEHIPTYMPQLDIPLHYRKETLSPLAADSKKVFRLPSLHDLEVWWRRRNWVLYTLYLPPFVQGGHFNRGANQPTNCLRSENKQQPSGYKLPPLVEQRPSCAFPGAIYKNATTDRRLSCPIIEPTVLQPPQLHYPIPDPTPRRLQWHHQQVLPKKQWVNAH